MDKKEKLKEEINKLRQQLYEIESEENSKVSSKLVGRYFKYRNSYSCPEKPSDYWDDYIKVVGYSGSHLDTILVRLDSHNHALVRKDQNFNHLRGWTEVTEKDFKKRASLVQKHISELLS